MAKQKEGVDLLDDGQVRVVMDGKAHSLRRPKVGELRRFYEGVETIAAAEKEQTGDGRVSYLAGVDEVADWWRTVFTDLCADDDVLPDDVDDWPVWLLSGNLMGRVLAHWREVPYLSGG